MIYKGPETAKHVEGLIDPEEQIQPAGVDLTVSNMERLLERGKIDFENSKREIPEGKKIQLEGSGDEKYWRLEKGAYRFRTNETVRIPRNAVGIGMPRSSLLRCGAGLDFAFWDPGFEGTSEAVLKVPSQGLKVYENARIFQFALADCREAEDEYKGVYGE